MRAKPTAMAGRAASAEKTRMAHSRASERELLVAALGGEY